MPTNLTKSECTDQLKEFLIKEFPLCPNPLANSTSLSAKPKKGVGIDKIGLIADDLEEVFAKVKPHPLELSRSHLEAAAPTTVEKLRDLIWGRLDDVPKAEVEKALKKCISEHEHVSTSKINLNTKLDDLNIRKEDRSEYVLFLEKQFIGMIQLKIKTTDLKKAVTVQDWLNLIEPQFKNRLI